MKKGDGLHSYPVRNPQKQPGLPMTGPLAQQMSAPVYGTESGRTESETVPSVTYWKELFENQNKLLARLQRSLYDKTHPVDEYQSTAGLPSSSSIDNTQGIYKFRVQPTYDIPELIESIIYTIPAGASSAIIKLGDRRISVFPANISGQSSSATAATAGGPAAGQTVVQLTGLPPGEVEISWIVRLNAAGGVVNNFALNVNGTQVAQSINGDAANTLVPQIPETVELPLASNTIAVTAIAVDTVSYQASLGVVYNSGGALTVPYSGTLSPIGLVLNQDDDRVLEIGGILTSGPTHFELMGHADEIYGNA